MKRYLVITVCRGNIGRSPFAAAVLNQEIARRGLAAGVAVASRGVQGTAVDPKPVRFPNITYYKELYEDSRPTLESLGIDVSGHVSTPITGLDAQDADILLAMDAKTRDGLMTLFPDQAFKVHLASELVGEHRDIVDPDGVTGVEKQRQIFTDLSDTLVTGLPELMRLLHAVKQQREIR